MIHLKSMKRRPKVSILHKEGFAARLIELEISVELHNLDLPLLHELIELYNQAIDYFIVIQSDDYVFFKNKLTTLLLKPRVVNVLKREEILSRARDARAEHEDQDPNELVSEGDALPAPSADQKPSRTTSRALGNSPTLRERGGEANALDLPVEHTLEFELKMQTFNLNKDVNTTHQTTAVHKTLTSFCNQEDQAADILKASFLAQQNSVLQRLQDRKNQSRNSTVIKGKSFNDQTSMEGMGGETAQDMFKYNEVAGQEFENEAEQTDNFLPAEGSEPEKKTSL